MSDQPDLEMKYRKLLWLSHGHQGLYGDDGEMQCGHCRPFDYKRAPLEDLERAAFEAKLGAAARAEGPSKELFTEIHDAWSALDGIMVEAGMDAKLQPEQAQAWLRARLAHAEGPHAAERQAWRIREGQYKEGAAILIEENAGLHDAIVRWKEEEVIWKETEADLLKQLAQAEARAAQVTQLLADCRLYLRTAEAGWERMQGTPWWDGLQHLLEHLDTALGRGPGAEGGQP